MKTLLLSFALLCAFSSSAQLTEITVEHVHSTKKKITNTSPYQYIISMDLTLKNSGASDLKPEDTVYVYWREDWSQYVDFARFSYTGVTLAPGEILKKEKIMLSVFSPTDMLNSKFCIKTQVVNSSVGNNTDSTANEKCEGSQTTGIANAPKEELSIYPNPSNNQINVEANYDIKPSSITISDIHGKQYKVKPFQSGTNTIQIQTNHLAAGIYYLKITQKGENMIYRFLKE